MKTKKVSTSKKSGSRAKRRPSPRTGRNGRRKGSRGTGRAILKSDQFLRQVIDLVPHFVFAKDEHSRFLLMNKAIADAYGTSPERALGKSDIDFSATPKEARHFHDDDLSVIKSGKPKTIPVEEITDVEGKVRYLQTTKIPAQFGREMTPGILGVAVDITELKRSERLLQESEEKYRNFVERALDGIAVIQDGIIKYLNPVLADILGGPIEMALGTGFLQYVHPDERPKLKGNYEDRMAGQAISSTYETILLGPDARAIPVEVNAGLIQFDGRAADLVIIRDTRERKKGEEAVARRDAMLRVVHDAAEQFLKSPEASPTINTVLRRLGGLMRVDRVYICQKVRQKDGSECEAEPFSWHNDARGGLQGGPCDPRFSLSDARLIRWEKVLSTREVVYGNVEDFPECEQIVLKERGIQSILILPIFAGSRWWGFIGCDDCHAQREWSVLDKDALESLASIVGSVMQKRETERVQDAVYRIAQAAGSTHGIYELCRSIHEIISDIMEAKNFYVALYDEKEGMLSFPYFVDEFDPPYAPKKLGRGLTEYVLRAKAPLLCTEEKFRELTASGEAVLVGNPSPIWLGVPLIVDDKAIGVMAVQHYEDESAYGEQEQQVLEYVSSQIARAVERKRADDALAFQTAYFQRLFEDGPTGIVLLDMNDNVVRINRSFQAMFGYSQEEAVGRDINELIVAPHMREEAVNLSWISQHGRSVSKESVRMRKDGSRVNVDITAYPIAIEGKHAGVYGMYEDISERKVLEAQVLHAQKMESIGTLAGGIAHDFNNLLAIILGHSTLLERANGDEAKRASSIQAITKAAERAAGVVRQLLTFARKTEQRRESVRVNDVIQELLKFLKETFPKSIVITSRMADNLPSVVADATQLHQVFMNIFVNARDAMPRGGSLNIATAEVGNEIVARRFAEADAPSYVEITATDNGIGMDEKTRRRVFEPFFSTKEVGRGTGLGMAVAFGIIESHHGYIDVESSPGTGSRFTVYLPVQPRSAVSNGPLEKERQEAPGGTESILIIEDEPEISELLRMTLQAKGYSVLSATDGTEALDLFKSHHDTIDLVISDVGLPSMSGDQLFFAIKKLNPHVKAILASGYIEPDLKAEAMRSGVRAFLQKPYGSAAVLQVVRQVLQEP
ncbi:MAG TPA: PAS domain S-box protein [Bacteroidota bacterium]|nr:PAS domain S-box protein [Bacteroidota bacterium]